MVSNEITTNEPTEFEIIEEEIVFEDDVPNENSESNENVEESSIAEINPDELTNRANHPYILSLGGHSSYVGENILLEQMAFRKFKKRLNLVVLGAKQSRRTMKYWESYGMLPEQMSALEQAILKGVKFDYDAMARDFDNACAGQSNEFFTRFESLHQICQIKTIESKLLSMFDSEIQRERDNGQISIYQNIVTATDYIYNMFATRLAEETELMKAISFDGFFVDKTKKWFRKRESQYPKDILLEDYLELPKLLTNECIQVAINLNISEKDIDILCDSIEDMTREFSELNEFTIKAIRERVESAQAPCNESMEYSRTKNDKEDVMFS